MIRHLGSRRTKQEGIQLRGQAVIDLAMMTGRGREAHGQPLVQRCNHDTDECHISENVSWVLG